MIETMVAILVSTLMLVVQLFGISFHETSVGDAPGLDTEPVTALVTDVIDGDTIAVVLPSGEVARVRYIGIDTPEPYREGEPECGSKEASARNRELVAGKTVILVADTENTDRYDRLLRYVYIDDVLVNEVLLKEGYADTLTIAPNTKYASAFNAARDSARASNVGMWNWCRSLQ